MFDNVVMLDETLRCSHGHRLSGFQTKSFDDPSADVYLFDGPRVYRVVPSRYTDLDEIATDHWRLEDTADVADHPGAAIKPDATYSLNKKGGEPWLAAQSEL